MATNTRDVKLTVGVETTGAESVAELADGLRDVGTAGQGVSPAVEKLGAELEALTLKTKDLRTAEASARSEAAQQKQSLDGQRDALARLRIETDKAGKATDEYKLQERGLRLAVVEGRAALRDKQAAVTAAATSSRIAAAEEQNLAAQLRTASTAYKQLGSTAQTSAAQQNAANKTVASGLAEIGGQLRTVQSLAVAAIGGQLLGGIAGDVLKTADAYGSLAARIKLVTGEGAAFNTAFQSVFDVATRTGVAVEQTGTLFTRLAEAGKQIGISNAEALRLTESINQSVQIGGASAESSSAAVTQLIQGLQSGVLRGDEFNSIMEQTPRLAKALADGLGVTTGELRKLAEAGSLTAATVIQSLQGQSAALRSEFESLPPTVGRAIQNLSNEWARYVGETDKATGASSTAAHAINLLASNLDTLGALLFSAGKAAAAYQAVKLAQTFIGIGTAARTATAEIAALTAAQTAAGASSATAAAGAGRLSAILGSVKVFALVAVLANLKEIGTAIGEGIAKWAGYGKAIEQVEAAAKAEEEATRANAASKAELAQKLQLTSDKALGLTDVSRKLVAGFDELKLKGESTADALDKVGKGLELKDLTGIANAGAALDALAVKGKISALDVQVAFAGALKGIDLATFATNARAAFDGSEQGARRLKLALDAVATESLTRAGTSVKELQTGFNVATVSAINDVDTLAATLEGLGVKGDQAGRVLGVSLDKALTLATTETAVKAVIARFEDLGKRGLLTGDQISIGLQKAREKIDSLLPGINSLDEALGKFGLKSRSELTRTADTLKSSYAQIVNSTLVSLADKVKAFEQYRAAAIAANGGVESSEVRLQAEILRMKGAAIDAGKTLGDSMDQAGQRVDNLTDKAREAAVELRRLSDEKYSNPKGGSIIGASREERLAGQAATDGTGAFALREKRRLGTLSADDLGTAEAVASAAKFNKQQFDDNSKAFSLEGTRSIFEELNSANTILAQVRALAGQPATAPAATAPTANSEGARSRTVNINMGGRRSSVSVSSQADSDVLVGVLRGLESAAGVSA